MFDSLVREALNKILCSNVDDTAWLQAQLPVSMGGLGLRSAANHSSVAFLSSVHASQELLGDMLTTLESPKPDTSAALSHLTVILNSE